MVKKLILFFSAMLTYSLSFAQIKYGLKIGITQSYIKNHLEAISEDMNVKGGFQFGITSTVKIKKSLSLYSSIQLTQKGYKAIAGKPADPFYWNKDFSATYLELPVSVVYNIRLNKASGIFIGTGAVFSLGLFGNLKTILATVDSSRQLHTENIRDNKTFTSGTVKRGDLGWNFLTGIQCRRFSLSATYDYGILNTIKDPLQNYKNRSFSLAVGYSVSR